MRKERSLCLSVLVLLCLALLLPSPHSSAQGTVAGATPEGFTYEITGQEAAITGYKGTDREMVIPDRVQGAVVTGIGDRAFFMTGLTSVTIPDSVVTIGNQAFSMTGLTSVTIPDSVVSIGFQAFFRCTSLSDITIPRSVDSIGAYAFFHTPVTIHASPNSTAHRYATDNRIPFAPLEE